jgi:hypothetical protein
MIFRWNRWVGGRVALPRRERRPRTAASVIRESGLDSVRLLMIFFHLFMLLHGLRLHLLPLGLLFGCEHTVDLVME